MLSFPAPTWRESPKKKNLTKDPNARAASEIVPRLYLSDYFTASSAKDLQRLKITHVVSVMELEPTFPEAMTQLRKLHIAVADRPDVDIGSHLEKTTAFIRAALAENAENRVLVHCFQGVSRSATVVCAYLVATTNMVAAESVAFCQAKRGIICPNPGFRTQLETYSNEVSKHRVKTTEGSGAGFKLRDEVAGRIRQFKRLSGLRSQMMGKVIQED